jgi:hypothetical protein
MGWWREASQQAWWGWGWLSCSGHASDGCFSFLANTSWFFPSCLGRAMEAFSHVEHAGFKGVPAPEMWQSHTACSPRGRSRYQATSAELLHSVYSGTQVLFVRILVVTDSLPVFLPAFHHADQADILPCRLALVMSVNEATSVLRQAWMLRHLIDPRVYHLSEHSACL